MRALLIRELKSVFCSLSGAFFSLSYLLIIGCLLWGFSGNYNILDGGYVSMSYFFSISAFLFIFLIPALTMRSFSEERKSKTLDLLLTRPVRASSIYFSKYFSLLFFVVVVLLPTLVYVVSLSYLAYPVGNIDCVNILISYASLLLLVSVFLAIGIFSSSLTDNQVVAFILSAVITSFVYFGFELIAQFFLSGKMQLAVSSFGLSHHFLTMQKGVIHLSSILCVVGYLLFFTLLTIYTFNKQNKLVVFAVAGLLLINIFALSLPNIRFDFTEDKRYSISDYSKQLLTDIDKNENKIEVKVWLEGDLNPGFQQLQNSVRDLLADFNSYAGNSIEVVFSNPYLQNEPPVKIYDKMARSGMDGIVLNEVDREGKTSQKIIYPYAQIINGQDTVIVSFLKNIKGYTAEENLNASIESLEFEFVDAIKLMCQKEEKNIAFVEGHGELSRSYVYDAEELLSKYYSVNRGQIGNEVGVLDNFSAVIIAGPIEKYSEDEKYVLDQYIMGGGKVLWLVDGAYYSQDDLSNKGQSASVKNETNLDDLLFTYGVRINADFVQDKQCSSIYLMSGDDTRSSVLFPCPYMPLLMPSANHVVTKDIRDLMSAFASSIDAVNNSPKVEKHILLTTSAQSYITKVPEIIDLDMSGRQGGDNHFNQSYIPIAMSLEGVFNSAFAQRLAPDSIVGDAKEKKNESIETKMIVVSSSHIIRNDIEGKGENTQIIPMGFDQVSNTQFGNRDFIVNAVNWLTDDAGLMQLRAKQQKIRVLDKQNVHTKRSLYSAVNVGLPVLLMLVILLSVSGYRMRKYK